MNHNENENIKILIDKKKLCDKIIKSLVQY